MDLPKFARNYSCPTRAVGYVGTKSYVCWYCLCARMPSKYLKDLNDNPIRNVLHGMPKSYNNNAYDLHLTLN